MRAAANEHPSPGGPAVSRPANLGFLGCGWAFDLYLESLARHPGLRIAGAADLDRARLDAVCRHYGIAGYESNEALLADPEVDVVVNLTPIPAHYAVTKAALLAGKHVYSEKPIADDAEQARELFALAKSRGLHLAGAPSVLFGDTALTMWKAVEEGAVGKPRLAYAELDSHAALFLSPERWRSRTGAPWPWRAEFEAGCTLEHSGYHLSWMCAMFGPIASVTAFSDCLIPEKADPPLDAPDFSVAVLKFESGVVGRLTCSLGAPYDHAIRVIGSEGVISADTYRHYRGPVRLARFSPLPLKGFELRSVRGSTFLSSRFGVRGRRVPLVRGGGGERDGPGPTDWWSRLHRREHGWQDKCIGIAELADAIRTGRRPFPGPEFWEHLTELSLLIHDAGAKSRTRAPGSRFEPLSLPARAREDASDWRRAARPPLLETLYRAARRCLRALRPG